MQGDELRPGRRAELLAQQDADVVVGADGLGDVAALDQHLDQRRAGRLAKRRQGDRRARGPFGARQILAAAGDELQGLDPLLLEIGARAAEPRHVEVGQQPGLREGRGDLRGVRVQPGARGGEVARDRLDVDPYRLGEHQPQRVAAFEHRGLDGAPQAGEDGRQRGVARRRALVRPQRLDQLVAADRARPVQHQVREREPPLAPAQLRLTALTGELHAELATQMDRPAAH